MAKARKQDHTHHDGHLTTFSAFRHSFGHIAHEGTGRRGLYGFALITNIVNPLFWFNEWAKAKMTARFAREDARARRVVQGSEIFGLNAIGNGLYGKSTYPATLLRLGMDPKMRNRASGIVDPLYFSFAKASIELEFELRLMEKGQGRISSEVRQKYKLAEFKPEEIKQAIDFIKAREALMKEQKSLFNLVSAAAKDHEVFEEYKYRLEKINKQIFTLEAMLSSPKFSSLFDEAIRTGLTLYEVKKRNPGELKKG